MEFSLSLVIACLLLPASGEDVVDRMVPGLLERFPKMQEILLPIPDQILKEAIFQAGSFYIPLDSETELCRNHSSFMFESFLKKDLWALRMVDASSKLPSGLLDGNMWDLGSYDQCISVEAPDGLFRGQHCLVETKGLLPDIINSEIRNLEYPRLHLTFSVCVPSSCTARDVATHIDVSLNSVNASAIMFDGSCSSALPRPLDTSDWAAISVLAIITIILVLSTVYDYRCTESEKNQVLTAFSLSTNLSRMLDTHSPPATLPCLNGLRVLAFAWIILGHRFCKMLESPNLRFKTVAEFLWDTKLRKKWVIAVKKKNFNLGSCARLCLKHFKTDQFQQRPNADYFMLKPGDVPSVFYFPDSLSIPPPKKRSSIRIILLILIPLHLMQA